MKDPVYKLIELTGTSTTSIEDAIESAIKRANKTIKDLCCKGASPVYLHDPGDAVGFLPCPDNCASNMPVRFIM